MAADDVYLAMVHLEDPDKAAAAGDWTVLGDLDLTDDERAIVQDMVDEGHSEVSGFAAGARFRAVQYTSGHVSPALIAAYNPASFRFGAVAASCGASSCSEDQKKGGGRMPGVQGVQGIG